MTAGKIGTPAPYGANGIDRFMTDRRRAMRPTALVATGLGCLLAYSTIALAADVESLPGADTAKPRLAEQCLTDLQAFDEELAKVGFGILPPGGYGGSAPTGYYVWGVEGTPRQKIQSLRDAAYVYGLGGDEKSCQLILGSMRQIYQEHQKLVGTESDDPNIRTAWRRAHLSRAKPITQMSHLMRADVLIGSEIRNLKDEKLGEIEDVVLDPEKRSILYVLASYGGFLGYREKLAAIRWGDLRATDDHELYLLDASPKALEDAPRVNRRNFESTADADWQQALSAYWDRVLKP